MLDIIILFITMNKMAYVLDFMEILSVSPLMLFHLRIIHVMTFIKNYARAHGLPLPGRVPGHRDKVMVLPSDITKTVVFTQYKEACIKSSRNSVGRSPFFSLWQSMLPHISVSKPSSDLCLTCQQNSLSIQQSVVFWPSFGHSKGGPIFGSCEQIWPGKYRY